MKIIALTGKAGSGKDTAALLLQFMTSHYSDHHPVDIEEFIKAGQRMSLRELNNEKDNFIVRFQIAKFAYPVYQIAAILTGHETVEEIMNDKFKTSIWAMGTRSCSGREILQKVGEGMRKAIDEGVWIGIMSRKIRNSKAPGIIISDLRMLDEFAFLKGAGATVIRIDGRQAKGVPSHRSETELEHIGADYVVTNNGSYLGLARQLEIICKQEDILNCKYQWKTS